MSYSEFYQRSITQPESFWAEQAQRIAAAQSEHNGLATRIAHAAGIRAHELLTLRRGDERLGIDTVAQRAVECGHPELNEHGQDEGG